MSDSYAKADALKAQLDVSEHDLARLLQSAEADADQVRLAVRRCWQRRTELHTVEHAAHEAQRIPSESGRSAREESVAWRRGHGGRRPLVRGTHAN